MQFNMYLRNLIFIVEGSTGGQKCTAITLFPFVDESLKHCILATGAEGYTLYDKDLYNPLY
jgi:hypothetical protein